MKKRVLLPLMLCLALALAFGVTACGGTDDDGNGPSTDPVTHTVTYVAGNADATGTAPTQTAVEEGKTFTVAENTFTLEGHTFAGWSDGSKTYAAGDTYTMGTANVTLTAQWTANPVTYTVTYAAGAETATGTAPTQAALEEDDTFTVAENTFTYADHVFFGWSDGETVYQPGETYTMGASDATLTAVWLKASDSDMNGFSLEAEFTDDTMIWKWTGYNPHTLATFSYTKAGNVMTLTEQPAEDAEGEPGVYTLTYIDGFLTGTLFDSNGGEIVSIFAGDKTIDSDLCGVVGYVQTVDFSLNVYLYTDGSAIYKDVSDYMNQIVEFGTYTEEEGIVSLQYGTDSELVFKISVIMGGSCMMTLNDGLGGTYTAGDMSIVLDGYLGGTVDGAVCTYTVLDEDSIYLVDEDNGVGYMVTLDTEAKTATAEAVDIYLTTTEYPPFTQLLYLDGQLWGLMQGESPIPEVVAFTESDTEGTYTYETYMLYTAVVASGENTITVKYESSMWDPDQGGFVTQVITVTYTKA